MKHRKKKMEVDKRPKWSDDLTVRYRGREYTAEEYRVLCEETLAMDMSPHWKHDPSYNWNRRKK